MAEYIEREAAERILDDVGSPAYAKRALILVPAADVAAVVHGRWELLGDDYASCTNCGTIFETRPTPYFFEMNNKFCRSCGARMDRGNAK